MATKNAEATATKLLRESVLGRDCLCPGWIRPVVSIEAWAQTNSVVANAARGAIAAKVFGETLFRRVRTLSDINGRSAVWR
jgi:hypothetical protein